MNEQWKPVLGNEGLYEVSHLGMVRGLKRNNIRKATLNTSTGRNTTYYHIVLCKNNKFKTFLLHRVVAEAFLGKCPIGYEVAHEDGNSHNNNLSNLKYKTHAENVADAVKHGNLMQGENHYRTPLTAENVREIRWLYSFDFSQQKIADYYGIARESVRAIVNNKTWRSVNA